MSNVDRASTRLPPAPRPRRRDVGRTLALVLCFVFAFLGVLPVVLAATVRSSWAQRWAQREIARVVLEQGIVASYKISVVLWPLTVRLDDVRVESSDGGEPLVAAPHLAIRPRFFGLLSGKLAIDQIDVDTPRVRVVLRDGKLANLKLSLPEKSGPSGPFHAPFTVFAITEGDFDVDVDGVHGLLHGVDLDLTAEDDPDAGSSFEIAVRSGEGRVDRARLTYPNGEDKPPLTAFDEDHLCFLDGRVRIDPGAITVHRLRAAAAVDLDDASGTLPGCDLPDGDRRRVELAMSHLHVTLPKTDPATGATGMPHVDGHVTARAPIGLGARAGSFPENDGWVRADLDVEYGEGDQLPSLAGHVDARDLRILRYRIAAEVSSDIVTKKNVIVSPLTKVKFADGEVSLSDVEVEPLAKGIPLRLKLDVKDVEFPALMRDLGVSQHAHVSWDLHEVHCPTFGGTLDPLKLDCDLQAKTANFAVYDLATDDPLRTRVVGVREAQVITHVAVRPDALQFKAARVITPKSTIDGGFVSLAYKSDLRVDVGSAKVDLGEIGPLGSMPIAGLADVEAHVFGPFSDPHLDASIHHVNDFVLSDIPFGNVTAGKVSLTGLVVSLKDVKATKGKSTYEMPSGVLDFGGNANMTMDAQVTSGNFDLRDFFALWKMEDDPRFLEMGGIIATNSNVHVALGGREDRCGGGFIDVDAHARLRDVSLFGESFEDGDLDVDYEWQDRLGGLQGAIVEVHAATLRKVRPNPQGVAVGTVLGSAAIDHGAITGSVVLQGLPLSKIQSLGALAPQVDGALSGFVQVGGTIDAYKVEGDVDVTPMLVRGARVAGSHAHLRMTQTPPAAGPGAQARTRCGAPISPPFDKAAYLRDASSQGEIAVDGDLFGGQVLVKGLTMTRQADARVTGVVSLRKVDLGLVSRIASPPPDSDDEAPAGAAGAALEGELSGDLTIDQLKRSDLAHARVRFVPASLTVARGGQRVTMRPSPAMLLVSNDTLAMPPLVFDLAAQGGLHGAVTVRGTVNKLTTAPELALSAELAPIDLGVLVGVIPKLDRAQGTLSGELRVFGKARAPEIDGRLQVHAGEFVVHDVPGTIGNVEVDIRADASEVRIARGTARYSGGTLTLTGRVPIRDLSVGATELDVSARGVRLAPADGVIATVDADLVLAVSAPPAGDVKVPLPHLSGDVLLTSFEYTRPIALTTDLTSFGRAKRTVVETYDPSLDAVTIDLRVRNRAPLRIRNNLVEIQLGIDSGALLVSGTNQRVGLRGELRAQAGGRFHLRSSDFDVRQAIIRFDDPTRIVANVDVLAITEYRRYGDAASTLSPVQGRQSGLWRITLHAYGDTENLRLDMTSDPPLSQEDIVLLLTVGMTRAEVDQLQAGALGAGAALEALNTVSGADQLVKTAVPIIDDFRFGSGYSSKTGGTVPQVTLGKRVTDAVRANVTTGLSEDRELRANIEWRLGQRVSVQGSYDNVNDISSLGVGNVGVDFRYRLEFR